MLTVDRLNADDIEAALYQIFTWTCIPRPRLRNSLLGTARLVVEGRRTDCGDIDLLIDDEDVGPQYHQLIQRIMAEAATKSKLYTGFRIGTYWFQLLNRKTVKVDMMFSSSAKWTKWAYHSEEGGRSKYSGAVRNVILRAITPFLTSKLNEDFSMSIEYDQLVANSGREVIRARCSLNLSTGLERLFKMAKYNKKTGKYNKTLEKVTPAQIQAHLEETGRLNIQFSHEAERTNDPDEVARVLFGEGVKGDDLLTAEDVISLIQARRPAHEADLLFARCRAALEQAKLPCPKELLYNELGGKVHECLLLGTSHVGGSPEPPSP